MLIARGANLNIIIDGKNSALSYAASNGHENIMRLLIENGADINAGNSDNMSSLLIPAILGGIQKKSIFLQKKP